MLKRRKATTEEKYKIVKVIQICLTQRRVTINNALDKEMVFLYDGYTWHWDSGHLVDRNLSKQLNKEYKKYLKKESKKL